MRLKALAIGSLVATALSGCGVAAVPAAPANIQPPLSSPAAEQASATTAEASAPASASPAANTASASPAARAAEASPSAAKADASASKPAAAEPPAPAGPPVAPTPSVFRLTPLTYIRQTLNNCGPASIAEVMHYWGVDRTQEQARLALRPDGNSRGMMPYPVPAYVQGLGLNVLMGINGTPAIVKALVANGFPVIVAQNVSLQEPIAHYREIEGFNDDKQTFVSTDSYLGPNHEISYSEFDQLWGRGNQRFMVIYPPDKKPLVDAVLKSVGWDKKTVYENELAKQQRGEIIPFGPGAPNNNFARSIPGMSELNMAWDYIQLGRLDEAKAQIAKAPQNPRNAQLIGWLNQAMTVATA